MDGGLLANNPSLELLEEISKENALAKKHNNPNHELECFVSLGTGKAPIVSVDTTSLEIGTALIGAIKKLAGILMDQTNVALDTIEDRILVDTLWEARTYIREQCEQDVHDLNEMLH
ncbi:hypothetical protein niasHT_033541 [Heterodera trifolii]|uniref:PNPLA domain-containing protein n=1 Tax=Heterodera trifolii TaxID=157864 RepID=A0ABD2HYC9_9BILA